MDTVEIIRQNLSAIGEDYDSLKPFMKKWLEKVETAIQSRKSIQEEAVSTLKSVDYSVKAIAAEIGASRTTIYNHEQLLKRYIEQSTIVATMGDPLADISRLQSEKSILQEQISMLMDRDVDIEILKMQNRTLSTILEGKNAEIQRLEARVAELSAENQQLKMPGKTSAGQARVTPFKKK